MAASANFTVNGNAVPPEIAVSASTLVTLALLSATGVDVVSWSIIGNHSHLAVNPTITPAGTPLGRTATFTMPSGAGQAYLIQCQVNGGVDSEGVEQSSYTRTAIVGVVDSNGDVPFAFGENFERSATHGTVEAMNAARLAGAGDVSGPAAALDLELAAYDGTSGKALKRGGVNVSDMFTNFNVKMLGYGASPGALAAANTAAIRAAAQAAHTMGGGLVYVPRGIYLAAQDGVTGATIDLSGLEGITLMGAGIGATVLKIANAANCHGIKVGGSAKKITIRDLEIDGNKANNTTGHGVFADILAEYVTLRDSLIRDCKNDGARFKAKIAKALNNYVLTNDGQGITGDALEHFTFNDNTVKGNGFHGIGMIGPCEHGTINSNEAHDNGGVSPFADNITGYNSGNHHIEVVGNECSGGANNGIHVGGHHLTIGDNGVTDAAQYGLVVFNHESPTPSVSYGHTIAGNRVDNCPRSGFWLDHVERTSYAGNHADGCGESGHYFDIACKNISGDGNTASGNTGVGLRVNVGTSINVQGDFTDNSNGIQFSGSTKCRVASTCNDNALRGIYILNTTETLVTGSVAKDNGTIGFEEDGTSDNNTVTGNDFFGNGGGGDAPLVVGAGTQWRSNRNGGTGTVAAAAALTLPATRDEFYVTGTTAITSLVTNNWSGRRITLRFDDALTLTDGGNLDLPGSITTAFKKMVVLVGNGTLWSCVGNESN